MIPSMPRLSTPARSHSNTPSVPKMSGVAMRSTATQKGTPATMSRMSAVIVSPAGPSQGTDASPLWAASNASVGVVSSPADPVARKHRRHQHGDERCRDNDVGDVRRHGDGATHAVGPDQNPRDEDGGGPAADRIQLREHRNHDSAVAVSRRHVERDVAGAPGGFAATREHRETAREESALV